MTNRRRAILIITLLAVALAWWWNQSTWEIVRVSAWQSIKTELDTAREINRAAADRLASADIELQRAYTRLAVLDKEVNRRATQARGRVRDLDVVGIARELDRFSVGTTP